MINFEELSKRLLKYLMDFDWYDINDKYSYINNDEKVKKRALEEVYDILITKPEDILNSLVENFEEMDKEHELYNETCELIEEIKLLVGVNPEINL